VNQPLIQFRNVSKKFGKQTILEGTNLSIYQGEVTTIIGKSGEGKSVLLKHVIGLLEPDTGQILFRGQPLSKMRKERRKALKRKFSYMFQNNALFDSMTVFENIALPLQERAVIPEVETKNRVQEKMRQLDLHEIDDKYPSQLSGGMKKRVALARALVTDPEIVLFDDPTTGLDPIRKNAVHSMISDYQKRLGFTAILASNELPDVFYISQRIAMLQEGRILFEGSPEEMGRISNPNVQQFIRGIENGHDALTGMVHQSQAEKRFQEEMAHLQRHKIAFSLMIFTLENLGEINDKAGHVAGQTVLEHFAAELKRRLRISDICSRYGLNKIMVILPNTNMDQARMTCLKLAKDPKIWEMLEMPTYPGVCLSVTIGFAEAQKESAFDDVLSGALSRQSPLRDFQIC
jgi:phospholipid/cholesterol/gamma-HCH transport system ATP-binding protein